MNFTIKYEGINLDNGMNIEDFGGSLIGFSSLSKEIFKVGKIKADVDVKVTSVRKGSIIVDIALGLQDYIHSFGSFEDFLYFIELTNQELFNEITGKLQEIGSEGAKKWNSLEEYAKENPIQGGLIGASIFRLVEITFVAIKDYKVKHKNLNNVGDRDEVDIGNGKKVKGEALKSIKKIVNKGKSAHFLEPIIEDKVSNIKIGEDNDYIEINNNNFESFIGEGNEILPELKNGEKYDFTGSFTAMQSNRGETITFLSHHFKNNNNQAFHFSCYLKDGESTEDYSDFYGASKSLKVSAEVIRVSDYKKPKLKILDVELFQTSLNIEN